MAVSVLRPGAGDEAGDVGDDGLARTEGECAAAATTECEAGWSAAGIANLTAVERLARVVDDDDTLIKRGAREDGRILRKIAIPHIQPGAAIHRDLLVHRDGPGGADIAGCVLCGLGGLGAAHRDRAGRRRRIVLRPGAGDEAGDVGDDGLARTEGECAAAATTECEAGWSAAGIANLTAVERLARVVDDDDTLIKRGAREDGRILRKIAIPHIQPGAAIHRDLLVHGDGANGHDDRTGVVGNVAGFDGARVAVAVANRASHCRRVDRIDRTRDDGRDVGRRSTAYGNDRAAGAAEGEAGKTVAVDIGNRGVGDRDRASIDQDHALIDVRPGGDSGILGDIAVTLVQPVHTVGGNLLVNADAVQSRR